MHGTSEYQFMIDDVLNSNRTALSNQFQSEIRELLFRAEAQKQVQQIDWTSHSRNFNLNVIPLYNDELIVQITGTRHEENSRTSGITADLSLVLSHLEEGVLLEDSERKILFINEKFVRMLDLKQEATSYFGLSTLNLIYELSRAFHNIDSFYEMFSNINDQGNGTSVSEITLSDALIVEREFIPIEDAGKTTAFLWKLRDVTERKKSESKLQSYLDIMLEQSQATSQIQSAIITKGVEQYEDLVVSTYFPYFMDSLGSISDMIQISDDKYMYFIVDISHTGAKSVLYASAVKSVIFKLSRELEHMPVDEILRLVFSKLEHNLKINLRTHANLKVMLAVFDMKAKTVKTASLNSPDMIIYDNHENRIDYIKSVTNIEEITEHTVELKINTMIFLFTEGVFSLERNDEELNMEKFSLILQKYYHNFSYINLFPDNFERIMNLEGYRNTGKNFIFVNMCTHIQDDKKLSIKKLQNNHLYCIQSMLSEVGKIGRNCEFLVKKWTGNTWLGYKVELIVNEFLNNIIVHGLDSRKDAYIFVILSFGEFLELTFIDEGKEWVLNFSETKEENKEDLIKNLDELLVLNERGRGISMIKELAQDAVRNRIDNLNCTRFRLSLNKE